MNYSTQKLAEHKLIILYLIRKMEISLSNKEICDLLLEKEYMHYYSIQEYIANLIDSKLLELDKNNNQDHLRYDLTKDGIDVIEQLQEHISERVREEIDLYIIKNNERIHVAYGIKANYFINEDKEYLVKCSLADQIGNILMDISVTVISEKQAKKICRNWKNNVNYIYNQVMDTMINKEEK